MISEEELESPMPERDGWHDVPVAQAIGDARPRRRLAVTGSILEVRERDEPGPIFEADLDDGTGQVTLVYFGRRTVAGIVPGAAITAWATLLVRHGRLELLNPHYCLVTAPVEA
jgi:hypothetical protein